MMSDVTTPVEKLRAAFGKTIADVAILHGIPLVRVGKADVPLVAHYLHTHPELQGTLSLLWAVDHRPREKRYELSYLFTLIDSPQQRQRSLQLGMGVQVKGNKRHIGFPH